MTNKKNNSDRIILGIHPDHDGTAALLINGRPAAAIAEERLSRIKFHTGFPYKAVEKCLSLGGVEPEEVEAIIVPSCSFPYVRPSVLRAVMKRNGGGVDFSQAPLHYRLMKLLEIVPMMASSDLYKKQITRYGNEKLGDALSYLGLSGVPIYHLDHHLCHAASAYYTSGFSDRCLIVAIDGAGDGCAATAWIGENGSLRRISSTPMMYSPGYVYSAVTWLLGFKRNRHEGKITGLAAYGDPDECYDVFEEALQLTDNGYEFTYGFGAEYAMQRYLYSLRTMMRGIPIFSTVQGRLFQHLEKRLKGHSREDISAALQKRMEDLAARHVGVLARATGIKKVALAGGLFANVKINQKIAELDSVDTVFVHPDMGDGGLALGGAMEWHAHICREEGSLFKGMKLKDVYFGPEYTERDMAKALEDAGIKFRKAKYPEKDIAELVSKGKIVGRFTGRMEYGPRALGNRSILADPQDARINDWLNKRLKRTEFMPFAPSILEEDADKVYRGFDKCRHTASFMTITFDVEPEFIEKAPAVSHIDGTARPQAVNKDQNPSYHAVLSEYKKKSGLPLLINTSFNIHEEPIVCSPQDAVKAYQQGSVDTLAMGPFITETGEGK